jgi:2'-5' RNA ligase
VESHLESLGFEREKRAFHPHLTLGRTRRGISSSEQQRIGDVIGSSDIKPLGEVRVDQVHLMRSDLRPDGAVYSSMQSFFLGTPHSAEGQ